MSYPMASSVFATRLSQQPPAPPQLALCRRLLGVVTTTVLSVVARLDYRQQYEQVTGQSLERCPACGQGRMTMVATIAFGSPSLLPQPQDTS